MKSAGTDKLLDFFLRPRGRITRIEHGLGGGLIVAINAAFLTLLLTRQDMATAFLVVISILGLAGSFALLLFLPFIAPLWLILLAIIPGKDGPNPYGPAPTFQSD
jgi:uncharacterized membrane protein YhaH (DUF805 family)